MTNMGVFGPERLDMDLGSFINLVIEQLGALGPAGLIIGLLLIAVVVLWLSLQKERKRCEMLVDKMFEQTREANTMIERITGRK